MKTKFSSNELIDGFYCSVPSSCSWVLWNIAVENMSCEIMEDEDGSQIIMVASDVYLVASPNGHFMWIAEHELIDKYRFNGTKFLRLRDARNPMEFVCSDGVVSVK
jgi:hypothetical protein